MVVVVIAIVAITHKGSNNAAGDRRVAPTSVTGPATSVPVSVLDSVGVGSVTSLPKGVNATPLATSKPEVLFVGGEFCPYCAAERWGIVGALSRFGTFSNLKEISSSSTDVYPNTATFSFYKSSYTSRYLTFDPKEETDRAEKPLEKLTSAEQTTMSKYTTGVPFIDFDGKSVLVTPSYDPQTLKGLTQQQIADQLKDPTSKVAKAVDGANNVLTAAVCQVTNNQPSSVCSDKTITSIESQIHA